MYWYTWLNFTVGLDRKCTSSLLAGNISAQPQDEESVYTVPFVHLYKPKAKIPNQP